MKNPLMLITIGFYFISSIFYLLYLSSFKERFRNIAKIILFIAFLLHLSLTAFHHISRGYPPILHYYSLLSLGSFVLVSFFLFFEKPFKLSFYGAFLTPVITILLCTIFINLGGSIKPDVKVVKFITPIHIISMMLGFICFLISFFSSILYLLKDLRLKIMKTPSLEKIKLPSLAFLEKWSLRALSMGFPFYTFGIIFGILWIVVGDGRGYFLPQYFLSIISWIVYGGILFFNYLYGWRGRKFAVLVVFAFLPILSIVLIYGLR